VDPNSLAAGKVVLGRFDLEQLIIGMIGTREGIERLPGTLLAFDRAEFSSTLIQQAAREAIQMRTASIGSAMSYAMDCASSASKQRLAAIGREMRTAMSDTSISPYPRSALRGM
jgi:hypothetical protein